LKHDLEPAKNILRNFLSEIDKVKDIRKSISQPILTPFEIKNRTPDLRGIEFVSAQLLLGKGRSLYLASRRCLGFSLIYA
jgi:hypothetical protein